MYYGAFVNRKNADGNRKKHEIPGIIIRKEHPGSM
jgi:hypothetical protein